MENNLFIVGAVFSPLIGAVVTLFFNHERYERWRRYIGISAGLIAWLCSIAVLLMTFNEGPQTYRMGGWLPPFGIILVGDMLSSLFVLMSSTVLLGGILYALDCKEKCVTHPAFMALFLSMETGLLGAFTQAIFSPSLCSLSLWS